ncbi:uncharacterized [Tachysurus ichikawai]
MSEGDLGLQSVCCNEMAGCPHEVRDRKKSTVLVGGASLGLASIRQILQLGWHRIAYWSVFSPPSRINNSTEIRRPYLTE